MTRIFLVALFALSSLAAAVGQSNSVSGMAYVSFGKVRNPDGTIRALKGLWLPIQAERIVARTVSQPSSKPPPLFFPASQTVYNCDSGDYIISEPDDPSSLDDLVMTGGANFPWENLTFGVDVSVQRSFLIRWIGYYNYNSSTGHNQPAFTNWFADFGVIIPSNLLTVGTWKVTIAVGAAGVVSTSNTIYMAQQFRTPQPNGEGPFDPAMRNVYNGAGPPGQGSSTDGFWYDWDDLNGIYSNDEFDRFAEGSAPPYSNHLRTITTAGTSQSYVPFEVVVIDGVFGSGSLPDIWQNDGSYYRFRSNSNSANMAATVQGLANQANATSLKFIVDVSTDFPGEMLIYLRNYNTNAWDLVSTTSTSTTDSTVEVLIQNNPSRYINPSNRRMESKLLFTRFSRLTRAWWAFVDQTSWVVTHP